MIISGTTSLRVQTLFIGLLLFGQCGRLTARQANTSEPIDSLIVHLPAMMRSNESIARQMIDDLSRQSVQVKHRHGIVQSVFFKAWLSYRHSTADIAIASIDSALQHLDGIGSDTALVKFYILKGQCFVKKTQFSKALENFNQAIKVAESRNDQATKTSILISIGWAYMEDGKPGEAIRFFMEVLQLNPSLNYENRAVLLCNIASCYNTTGNFTVAESYALKGISAARNQQSSMDLANGLNILARSYYQQGKIEKAISCLKEAAVARGKNADPSMVASDYLELADLYSKNEQHNLAIAWAKKAEALSSQSGNSLKLAAAYKFLSSAYEGIGDYKKSSLYYKKLLFQQDSLADDHYDQALAQMQVQFETQKKTAEILGLKKENLETKLQNSNQQRWLVLLIGGLVLLTASVIYISTLMKSRYRTRLALEQLTEQKKRTLAVMEAEETERRRIAGDLHDGVGQTLAAASLQLNKARKGQVPLDKVDELINQAGAEVRDLSHQVTPELLLHYGLVKALEQAVDRLNDTVDQTDFSLYLHIEEPLENKLASLTIYRCFQELCNNIIKHARAGNVTIQLNLFPELVQLVMEDNGLGFQQGMVQYGLGIKNIKSRLALYDGEMLIDSTPGKGTTSIIQFQRSALMKNPVKTI